MQIPRELWDAARIDGSTTFRFLREVVIPLSRPALGTVAIYGFLSTYNQYFWPLLITNETMMRTTQVGIAQLRFEESLRCGLVMAGVIRLLYQRSPCSFGQRQLIRGLTAGASRVERMRERCSDLQHSRLHFQWWPSHARQRPSATGTGAGTGDQSALAPGTDVKPAARSPGARDSGITARRSTNRTNFNNSQSAIKVETVFQGSYDDLLSKLNTALASNAAPALVQVYDIGQRYMFDSGQVVPMQAFIDRDKYSTADFEPAVINYYKYQDKLQSMPFNSSSSIFYYNKDAFQRGRPGSEKHR